MKFLRPLKHWDHGFESHSSRGCLSTFFQCLCCPMQIVSLRRADPPSKESYRLSARFTFSELILKGNMPHSLIREGGRRIWGCELGSVSGRNGKYLDGMKVFQFTAVCSRPDRFCTRLFELWHVSWAKFSSRHFPKCCGHSARSTSNYKSPPLTPALCGLFLFQNCLLGYLDCTTASRSPATCLEKRNAKLIWENKVTKGEWTFVGLSSRTQAAAANDPTHKSIIRSLGLLVHDLNKHFSVLILHRGNQSLPFFPYLKKYK
jgi:hypothetical protein